MNKFKTKCDEIMYYLLKNRHYHFNTMDIVLPNFYVCKPLCGKFECDIFRLTTANLFYEYEIKTSRQDYFNDAKKINKIKLINNGLWCNRFYYIVPENLITADELHCDKMGLIYYHDTGYCKIIKNAKLLHKNKYDRSNLLHSLVYREQNHMQTILELKGKLSR